MLYLGIGCQMRMKKIPNHLMGGYNSQQIWGYNMIGGYNNIIDGDTIVDIPINDIVILLTMIGGYNMGIGINSQQYHSSLHGMEWTILKIESQTVTTIHHDLRNLHFCYFFSE